MAAFWEQQLMDRLLNLCFEFRESQDIVMPAGKVKDVVDYVKFLLENQSKEAAEDVRRGG